MSEILEQIRPGSHGVCPIYRVRCQQCGRVYQTSQTREKLVRNRPCIACRPPQGHAKRVKAIPLQHRGMKAGFT